MTGQEYEYLEKRWQEVYHQRRQLQKQLEKLDKEMRNIEKKLQRPIDNDSKM